MTPVFQFAELLDVEGLVVGTVGVDDGATDEEEGISEVVVGTGGKESEGVEDAMLQNCCARFSAAASSLGQSARTQADNSDVKRGLSKYNVRHYKILTKGKSYLTQKQFTSTTLVQFTLEMPTAKQFETRNMGQKKKKKQMRAILHTHRMLNIHSDLETAH